MNDFGYYQTLFDLCDLASQASDDDLFQISTLQSEPNKNTHKALHAIIHNQNCYIEDNQSLAVTEALCGWAMRPEHPKYFAIATAILVANDLQYGSGVSDTLDFFVMAEDKYTTLEPPIRTTIMRGFFTLSKRNYRNHLGDVEIPFPEPAGNKDRILEKLKNVARKVQPMVLESISKADYSYRAEEHLAALKTLVYEKDFQLPSDWTVPREVLQLTGHVETNVGFQFSTAILLMNAISSSYLDFDMEVRWEEAERYFALPSEERDAILSAYRFLYETEKHWNPSSDFMIPAYGDTSLTAAESRSFIKNVRPPNPAG